MSEAGPERVPLDPTPKTTFDDCLDAQREAAALLVEQAETISRLTGTPPNSRVEIVAKRLDASLLLLTMIRDNWREIRAMLFRRRG